MKKAVTNILAVSMAILVLLSTLSVTVEKHYCMGQLADFSLLVAVDGCEMPMSEDEGPDHNNRLTKVPCCSDIVELIEGTNAELKIAEQVLVDAYEYETILPVNEGVFMEWVPEISTPLNNHSPPLLIKDILVLYETFLI